MQNIIDIITSIDSKLPNVNPTQIYNEGWMTRLLMKHSIEEKIILRGLNFAEIFNWTSEALISSPFVTADKNREGYTHADIVFGDFSINYIENGKVNLLNDAKIFGIIEAKMGSSLSKDTKNFKDYNQASRSLLCISRNTYDKNCKTFFIVVAPKSKLAKIRKEIDSAIIYGQIERRFSDHVDRFESAKMLSKARECIVMVWSYEEWIEAIQNVDSKKFLSEFFEKTKMWNRIKK